MYCINPESDEPIFCIFDQIGKDDEKPETPYVDGNEFAKELLRMDGLGKKRIQIWINSEGGSVKEGYSIITAILQTQTKVDVLVIGIAYSIMAVAALMGRKIEMMDFSSLMFHNPYNPDGTVDKGLEVIKQSLITAVAKRTGKKDSEVASFMAATTFYTADEAKRDGFIDEVIHCGDSNAPRKTADTKTKQAYALKYANKYIAQELTKTKNSTPIITKTKPMKTVAKKLGLNEEASEDAIAFEIGKLQAKKLSDEDKMKKLEDSLKKAEDDLAKFKKDKADGDEAEAKQKAEDKIEADKKAKLDDEDKKAKKVIEDKKAEDAFKLTAKAKIELTIKNKGLTIADKAVLNYVDMAGTTEESLTKVIETIEEIPSTTKAADMTKYVAKDDKTGIPLIKTVGVDAKGHPVAGDTSEMVSAINSFKFPK